MSESGLKKISQVTVRKIVFPQRLQKPPETGERSNVSPKAVLRVQRTIFGCENARELTKSNETQRTYAKLRGEKVAIGPDA